MKTLGNFEVDESWFDVLASFAQSADFLQLQDFLASEYTKEDIFPSKADVFRCFQITPFDQVKVVILGQDPYHRAGQAHGLSFSVPDGVKVPPSLHNIQKELKVNLTNRNTLGCLETWAQQGVLLLNTVMTVRSGAPGSHRGMGWELFTARVLKAISDNLNQVVFLLWGKDACSKIGMIDQAQHLVLQASHPSPLSAYRGFFGCNHFDKANQYLQENQKKIVHWQSPWNTH